MMADMNWIGYAVVVSGLLGLGALVLERAARQLGWGTRWSWALALAGSLMVPLLARLRPERTVEAAVTVPVLTLPALGGGAATDAVNATSYLGIAWAALSVGVLLLLGFSYAALRRSARRWQRVSAGGGAVWVSDDVGPAVIGVLRPRVVVPGWVLELPAEERALLLLHEREHLRAGDARLVAAAYLAAVALPWNPVVWWQIARLRHAVELDCDARVLARGGRARRYGELLLEVGRRSSAQPLLAAAFGERSTRLEQRIRALLEPTRARRPWRGAAFALLGFCLLGTAYCVQDPMEGQTPAPAESAAEGERVLLREVRAPSEGDSGVPSGEAFATPADGAVEGLPRKRLDLKGLAPTPSPEGLPRRVSEKPAFTPMTVRPELLNSEAVKDELTAAYPPVLRDAGIGGKTVVWFLIDETGRVQRTQLSKSSGRAELDAAALKVASVMRFTPARNRDTPVPVWVEIPIAFQSQ